MKSMLAQRKGIPHEVDACVEKRNSEMVIEAHLTLPIKDLMKSMLAQRRGIPYEVDASRQKRNSEIVIEAHLTLPKKNTS